MIFLTKFNIDDGKEDNHICWEQNTIIPGFLHVSPVGNKMLSSYVDWIY